MTVKGGFVEVSLSPLYQACEVGYPPKMYATISVVANFPEDMPEVIEIIHKRIVEAQCKINLEICGNVDRYDDEYEECGDEYIEEGEE